MKRGETPPAFIPRPLLRAGREPRQGESKTPVNEFALPRPFTRIQNQDFLGKKFGFCSGGTENCF